jgi:hypothetical protein
MEPEGSLPCSQEPSTGPYPELNQSSLYHPILFKIHFNIIHLPTSRRSRDSVVGISIGYGLDDRGVWVRVPVRERIFSSPRRPDRLCGPRNLLSNGYRSALSPGVSRPGREADHSPPASTEVKKMWIYTSTPPYALTA